MKFYYSDSQNQEPKSPYIRMPNQEHFEKTIEILSQLRKAYAPALERLNELARIQKNMRLSLENIQIPIRQADAIFKGINFQNIQSCLKIMASEKAIKINYPKKIDLSKRRVIIHAQPTPSPKESIPYEKPDLFIEILPEYENWLASHNFYKQQKLSDLDSDHLSNLASLSNLIYKKFQINPNPHLTFELYFGKDFVDYSDSLNFLRRKNIVLSYSKDMIGNFGIKIKIELQVNNFLQFRQDINALINEIPIKRPQKSFPPEGITWQDITLKFMDGNNLQIRIGDQKEIKHYKEMGFEDKRTRNPNTQWVLLEFLAQHNGQISWDNSEAQKTIKKKKQRLSKTLQKFFNISEDPFYPYKSEESYAIKILFES